MIMKNLNKKLGAMILVFIANLVVASAANAGSCSGTWGYGSAYLNSAKTKVYGWVKDKKTDGHCVQIQKKYRTGRNWPGFYVDNSRNCGTSLKYWETPYSIGMKIRLYRSDLKRYCTINFN